MLDPMLETLCFVAVLNLNRLHFFLFFKKVCYFCFLISIWGFGVASLCCYLIMLFLGREEEEKIFLFLSTIAFISA